MKQTTTPDEPVVELPERIFLSRKGRWLQDADCWTRRESPDEVEYVRADLATRAPTPIDNEFIDNIRSFVSNGQKQFDVVVVTALLNALDAESRLAGEWELRYDALAAEAARDRSTSDNSQDQDSVEMQNEQAEREMRQTAPCRSMVDIPKNIQAVVAEIRARLDRLMKVTPAPWFVAGDEAEECGPHRNSGLALVDTGRSSDWPIARLCEWPQAEFIANAPTDIETLLQIIDSTTQATSGSEPNPSRREQMLTEMRDGLDQEAADNFRDTELSALLNRYTDPCEGECDHSQCPLLRDLRSLVESERIREVLRTACDKVKPTIDAEKEGEQVGDLMNIQLRSSSPYINPAGDETKSLGSVEEKNLVKMKTNPRVP